jgi:predicted amidohydrolase YtcJ
MSLLVVDVEVDGRRVDVRCEAGLVVDVGARLARRAGEEVLDGGGGALLPGLHDHHLHLLAMAAARESIDLGPDRVRRPADLDDALRSAAAAAAERGWLRAVGYDERTGGALDAARLDRLAGDRPTRVQHRSGHLWVLNTAACRAVGLDDRDGHLPDGDAWLAARLPDSSRSPSPPDLSPIGASLAAAGVTGVTDLTPSTDTGGWELLAAACRTGALAQRVVVTGGVDLADVAPPDPLVAGPVKVIVSDHHLPSIDDLAADVDTAHRAGRAVAVHCVTRVAAVLALAAWRQAGARRGDRMEHGAVLPEELARPLARLGVTVVTQPAFLHARGDRYLAEVDPEDVPHLYRCASLVAQDVALGGSTDAPYGPADPWLAMATAVDRRSAGGAVLGPAERLTPRRALELFLTPADDPGGAPRRVTPGAAADLCLLDAPLDVVLDDLSAGHVVATVVAGRVVGGGVVGTTPRV